MAGRPSAPAAYVNISRRRRSPRITRHRLSQKYAMLAADDSHASKPPLKDIIIDAEDAGAPLPIFNAPGLCERELITAIRFIATMRASAFYRNAL